MAKVSDKWKKRTKSQLETIIEALRNAGDRGCTNVELKDLTGRMNNSLSFLYMEGYKIRAEHLGKGVYRYVLLEEPETKKPRYNETGFVTAFDILAEEIENN